MESRQIIAFCLVMFMCSNSKAQLSLAYHTGYSGDQAIISYPFFKNATKTQKTYLGLGINWKMKREVDNQTHVYYKTAYPVKFSEYFSFNLKQLAQPKWLTNRISNTYLFYNLNINRISSLTRGYVRFTTTGPDKDYFFTLNLPFYENIHPIQTPIYRSENAFGIGLNALTFKEMHLHLEIGYSFTVLSQINQETYAGPRHSIKFAPTVEASINF